MSIFDLIPKVVSYAALAAAVALCLTDKTDAQVPTGYPSAGGGGYQPANGPSYSYGQRAPLSPGPFQRGAQAPLLQSNTQSNLIQGGANGSLIQGNVDQEAGPVNIMFLLDCSFSMKEKLNGSEKKMNAAKEVLEGALARIPNDVNVGLRVFGQGFSGVPDIDCTQTACLVPLGTHNRNSIIGRARTLEPFGLTPLTYALRQCAEGDFRTAQGPKTIILISDGADTCYQDPCAFIALLEHSGIKLKIDIVGLALTGRSDRPAREQLNCIAERSGGKYFDANTAGELIESISHSVDKAISGRVMPKPGSAVKNPETQPDLEKGAGAAPASTAPTASPPTASPNATTMPPGGPVTVPGGSTTMPGGSTTMPGGSTTMPGGSTTMPGGSTTMPGGSTTMPSTAPSSGPRVPTTSPLVH